MKIYATIAALFVLGAASAIAQNSSQPEPAKPAVHQDAAAAAGPAAQPKIDPAKEADIRLLLEVSGAKALMAESMASTSSSIRPLLANAMPPGEYREKLIDLFFVKFQAKVDLTHLIELAIPVYDKYFSDEEIKGLISFYQSPIGRKSIEKLPKLANEMRQAGEKWGQQVGQDSMKEVLAEHPEMVAAMEAASKSGKTN